MTVNIFCRVCIKHLQCAVSTDNNVCVMRIVTTTTLPVELFRLKYLTSFVLVLKLLFYWSLKSRIDLPYPVCLKNKPLNGCSVVKIREATESS